jgi:F-type H+-transporting ATPase subunit b
VNYEEIAKWSQIISALFFYAVIAWLWFKFISPALQTAQASKNKQIAEAERHRDEAKAALEALRHEIEGAKHDAGLIRARADEQARREASTIVEESREAGERALRNAQGELDRARAAARAGLRTEFVDKALALARADAERKVDASLDTQLVDRFAAALERGGKN